jgi:hypothetical protein
MKPRPEQDLDALAEVRGSVSHSSREQFAAARAAEFEQACESRGIVDGGAGGSDNPIVTGDFPFSLDAAQNPRSHRMENKSRECQPAHQVGPIVAAGDMSQFVKQDVVEFGFSNFPQKDVRENYNGVQESRGERRNHFMGYKKLRGARSARVAQTLLETHDQLRACGPGTIPQPAEMQVTPHNPAE